MGAKYLFVLVSLALYLGCCFSQTLILTGTLRDQAPDYMIHKNFPSTYWTCAFTDNPTLGSAGSANGEVGWPGTDFELPQWMYGVPREASATYCPEYAGEFGMMGPLCNASNNWVNCGTLLSDYTPDYQFTGTSPHGSIQSPTSFYNWFHDSDQTVSIIYNLTLTSLGGRLYGYDNPNFFPLDGIGWGDSNLASDGNYHNFAFCLEIHGHFSYQGGEVFQFVGDDDMWVYLDSRLVIDLGGPHPALSASVSLDDIAGLVKGTNYRFDMFYCERHTTESNLKITTSIAIACTYYDWCNICEGNGQSCCTAADIAECNDNNACTLDACAVLVPPNVGCQNTPITCNDNNLCTDDSCNVNTGCVFANKTCNDNSLCTTDSCVPATGCLFTTISCPGDKCNLPGCTAANGCNTTKVNCNDNNACTTDSCNPSTGCQNLAITCNDNNACTTDTCDTVKGCIYTPIVCNDNNDCTADNCSAASGCIFSTVSCNDNNACTADSCSATSGCAHSNITCNDGNACTTDGCNPASGCTATTINCNDNNACTTDSCSTTQGCQHVTITCNDNNLCTADSCDSKAGCVFAPITCSDTNACTNNTCVPSLGCQYPPINCNDSNACTADSCNTASGCVNSPINCNDNNPCTADSCAPVSGCVHTPQSCNHCASGTTFITCPPINGSLCFPVDCDPNSGACNITIPVSCNDSNNCTIDSCTAATGVCDYTAKNCNDNNACTIDSCDVIKGCSSVEMNCNDNNPCTTDGCTAGNCTNVAVAGNCLPCGSTFCTWTDVCNPETCVNSVCTPTPFTCNDNNLCTADSCYALAGAATCNFTAVVCDSSDLCSVQTCNQTVGACEGTPIVCDDGNPCTTDSCISGTGACLFSPNPCDQSNFCAPQLCNITTGNCDALPVDCDDNNLCTSDSCTTNSTAYICVNSEISCDSFDTGSLCVPPTCDALQGCIAGTNVCDDNNPCTTDTCIGYMNCTHVVGLACDDDNACTVDSCDSNQRTLATACSYTNLTCAATLCTNVTGCNSTSGCTFAPVVCPTPTDWCQVPICDDSAGCLSIPRTCLVSDADCYEGVCNSATSSCSTKQRPDWATITTSQHGGETCFAAYDKAETAGIITGGVIAGIVVAAVVFAVLAAVGARQAYLYMQLRNGNLGAAANNPLYAPSAAGGVNPTYN